MMSHSSHSAPPPPAPEIDPAATGAYGAYNQAGYAVESVQQPLPPLSDPVHPHDNTHFAQPSHTYGSDHRDSTGHVSYDQAQPSNFFDTAHVEAQQASAGVSNSNGYGSSNPMMTPPAGASSHSVYGSSPYQSSAAPMFHRASISGPVMHSHYTTNAPPAAGSGAQHSASTGDIWSTSTVVRPHTADGMFGAAQMGGLPAQWGMPAEYNRGPRGSTSSVLSDTPSASGNGKVFSYMSNGDDMSTTSSSGGGPYSSGAPRKRPRRRFDEIERLYQCKWPGCQKSYGTLNHLNAHVAMQKHGSKRSPGEFKEMRKAWRKGKREDEQRRQANQAAANEEALVRKGGMMFNAPAQPFMTHSGSSTSPSMGGSTSSFPSSASSSSFPPQQSTTGQQIMAPPPASSMMGLGGHANGSGQVPRYHQSNAGMPSAGGNHNFYGSGAGGQSSGGLGAYLMAHRGSI